LSPAGDKRPAADVGDGLLFNACVAEWRVNEGEIQLRLSATCLRTGLCTCLAAFAVGLTCVAEARGEFCGTLPPAGFDHPPNAAHTGRYSNPVYGYAVQIPAPLRAYTAAAGPERGFGMLLSWTPRAYLSVDAAYDAYYDISADGVHRRDLNAMRLHDQVLSDQASHAAIAHVAGGRYLTQLRCAADPQVYIHDDVIVVRNREIYRLNLQSVPERYAADVKLLDAMLRSWRWQALTRSYVK
jgi:hypothetical protein